MALTRLAGAIRGKAKAVVRGYNRYGTDADLMADLYAYLSQVSATVDHYVLVSDALSEPAGDTA